MRVVYRRYYREWAAISTILASTFSGVRVVKGFAQEQRETGRFLDRIQTFMGVSLTTTKMYAIYNPTISMLGPQQSGPLPWAVSTISIPSPVPLT